MFCQNLREVREEHDKSQEQIAKLLQTSRQQYARWESGSWQMPIEHYKTLAVYYNVSLDYLSGLTNAYLKLDDSLSRVKNNITITQNGNGNINIKN